MKKARISLTNAKLGAKIPSVNQPAVVTCRKNTPCKKGCYATKGNWTFSNVKESLLSNYKLYKEDSNAYFDSIIEQLSGDICYRFFRWHASGDIIDYKYLLGMIKVAENCPDTKFLAFTKQFEMVNMYLALGHEIPSNLHIVFSAWDKGFKVDNPFNLPVTYVDFKKKEKNPEIPEYSIPCTGSCQECKACWSLIPGQSVVFHEH